MSLDERIAAVVIVLIALASGVIIVWGYSR